MDRLYARKERVISRDEASTKIVRGVGRTSGVELGASSSGGSSRGARAAAKYVLGIERTEGGAAGVSSVFPRVRVD